MARQNPLSVELLRVQRSLDEEIEDIVRKIDAADRARSDWGDNQRKYTRQRFGIRKKTQTIPWKGASNLSVPLTDKAIRRWKPAIVRLLDATPVANFFATRPEDLEAAKRAEQTYDWLFKWEMNAIDEVHILADTVAHRGIAFVEVGWDYRTERGVRVVRFAELFPQGPPVGQDGQVDLDGVAQVIAQQYDLAPDNEDDAKSLQAALEAFLAGEPAVKLVRRVVVRDRPSIVTHDPIQVVVPPRETDVENADYICIQNIFTKDDLRKMARDGVLERGPVNALLEDLAERKRRETEDTGGVLAHSDIVRDDRDTLDELGGILQSFEDENSIEVWKIYTWVDLDRDGEADRAVIWYHPGTRRTLATLEYALPFNQWPVVRFDFEKTYSRRVYATRGISQLLSALQTETNKLHNARLNAVAIQLAPVFLVRSSGNFTRNLRWAPGTGFPVQHTDDVRPLQHDLRNLGEYLREEQFVRLLAEEYVGIFDATLGTATNPGERRTATEVEAVQAQVSGVFSLDAAQWQKSWRDVHALVWELWRDIGEDEVFIRIAGQTAPERIRKADIDRHFDIQPAGTPTSTNKAIELSRAREAMTLFWNPFTSQLGLIDMQKLADWYLSTQDFKRAKQIVNEPEAAAEQQTLMQAMQLVASGGANDLFTQQNQVQGQRAGKNARGQ